MFVGFEVNIKVELDLKFMRMVRWDTVIIGFQINFNVTYQSLTENVLNFKTL